MPSPFLILAPMEGVTDIIFRQVVAKAGKPDLFFTEFTNVSSYASEKGRHNALERLEITDSDKPIIAQIWGKNPEHFSETAKILESLGFSGIDLNFGCPDKHVNKAGGGSAMIRTPELAIECFKNAKNSTNLPVSIKTRLGWSDPEEYKTWLPVLLKEHPSALTVHLRTKKEMSKVPAHYELIPEITKLRNEISPETKLIINGDIKNQEHALKLYEKYPKIDGFMIGRGVFQNPYCFTNHEPTREELMGLLKLHLRLYEKYETDFTKTLNDEEKYETNFTKTPNNKEESKTNIAKKLNERKSHSNIPHPRIPYESLKHFFKIYVNNFPGAKELRAKLMETHSISEARDIIDL